MLASATKPSVSSSTAAGDALLTGTPRLLTAPAPLDATDCLPGPLASHLRSWAGYTSRTARLRVVAHQANALPGWSGGPNLLTGVLDPAGHATVAVPPRSAPSVTALIRYQLRAPLDAHLTRDQLAAATADIPALLGRPGEHVEQVALRWTVAPADLPSLGTWVAVDDPRLPSWLRPFRGPALCALDAAGHVVAGVGSSGTTAASTSSLSSPSPRSAVRDWPAASSLRPRGTCSIAASSPPTCTMSATSPRLASPRPQGSPRMAGPPSCSAAPPDRPVTLAVVWEPVAVDLATRFLADDPEGLRDLFEAVDALARSQDVGQAYAHQRKLLEMGRA